MKKTTLVVINEVSEKLANSWIKSAKVYLVFAAAAAAAFAGSTFALSRKEYEDDEEEEYYEDE